MKAILSVQDRAAVSVMGEDREKMARVKNKHNMARVIMVREKTLPGSHMVTITWNYSTPVPVPVMGSTTIITLIKHL